MILEIRPSNIQVEQTPDTAYANVRLEIPHDELTLQQMLETLIVPALLAVGYNPHSIEEYFGECEECEREEEDDDGPSTEKLCQLLTAWKAVTKRIVHAALLDNSEELSEAIGDYKKLKDIEA
jgi:hypothetical protein